MKPVNNILFIERKLNPTGGGVQRVSYTLGEKFRQEGYHVWYAFYLQDTDTSAIPEESKFRFGIDESLEATYHQFRSFVKLHNIDTLFAQNVYTKKMCKVYEMLKRELDINIIACLHENPDRYVNKDKWGLVLPRVYIKNKLRSMKGILLGNRALAEMKRVYAVADKYVLLSERFIPVWKEVCKAKDATKLIGINNPCSLKPMDSPQKENIVLVVGRMEESQKRISNILKVWKTLWKSHTDWKMVIVGDGPDLPLYRKIAQRYGLQNIQFEGHSDHVETYYQRSRIFLMTSVWEGFGMTLIEAQNAGGVPIVFDNFAALHDIVDASNGRVVKSNDLQAFTDTVDCLMGSESLLAELAENAMRSARSKFGLEVIWQQWKELFGGFESGK